MMIVVQSYSEDSESDPIKDCCSRHSADKCTNCRW